MIYENNDLINNVNIRGRIFPMKDKIALDWSASGVEFLWCGQGQLALNFEIISDWQNTRFVVEIDNLPPLYCPVQNKMIVGHFNDGRHIVKIYKTSENAGNLIDLISIEVEEGYIQRLNEEKPYNFIFLGDSITCGNQISKDNEDAYLSYPTLVAKHFHADYQVIAISARGLLHGLNFEDNYLPHQDLQMDEIFKLNNYYRDKKLNYEVSSFIPNVFVINIGNNDLGPYLMEYYKATFKQFGDAVIEFYQYVRNTYPKAKIIFVYGGFVNHDYLNEYQNIIESIEDQNLKFLSLPPYDHGDLGHPSQQEHEFIANKLISLIKEML